MHFYRGADGAIRHYVLPNRCSAIFVIEPQRRCSSMISAEGEEIERNKHQLVTMTVAGNSIFVRIP